MLFKATNMLMAWLFILAAGVQYNDPDPLRWIGVYLAAAVVCALVFVGWLPWALPAALGVGALAWAAWLAPGVVGRVYVEDLFAEWEMANAGVEQAREMGGLLIVAAWMAVVALWAYRRGRGRAAARS